MLKQNRKDLPLDLSKKLNVAHINMCTEAEGPHKRMAIWFQGCNILCEGCCNTELQPIVTAHIMTLQEIVDIALESQKLYGIEGVTFLGGEPTLQEGLSELAKSIGNNNLGTILFTGKIVELLDEKLVYSIDLIVDGKFDEQQIDNNRNLIGSKNQRIHLLTDRYKKDMDWFYKVREKRVEVNIAQSTGVFISGDVL
ncbi:anaerobic ribonucleoside-triphosphate reductase activating protein [Natranaerovirga pectinivora]|uniref:Anaerobic ribonucleoside-triphosphate reductase-activating protein n=1 Tax=Natranaerovirga pectinivora TaxID=682400 RepID=A0A4R3MSK8_9FIRM|nr:4Fe-4S single cluster domain-containing protein [Natranaerovirga pectinivora]TCT16014.1 anaerobic ribonucleoside-triphosphate reductase activating protein [Natranaerovirga pectinivora]